MGVIEGFLVKVCVQIYSWAASVYQFILMLSTNKYVDQTNIDAFVANIKVLVGVFVLFRVAISMVGYIVDPDKIDDKQAGAKQLIMGIIVSVIGLLLFSPIFALSRDLQVWIIGGVDDDGNQYGENLFNRILLGATSDTKTDGFKCTYRLNNSDESVTISFIKNTTGTRIQVGANRINSIGKLLTMSVESVTGKKENGKNKAYKSSEFKIIEASPTTDMLKKEYNSCPSSIRKTDFGNYFLLYYSGSAANDNFTLGYTFAGEIPTTYKIDAGRQMASAMLFSFITCNESTYPQECENLSEARANSQIEKIDDAIKTGGNDVVEIAGGGLLPLIAGIVLLLFLITTTVDVAVRSLKLTLLEMVAPFPIVCYAEPKTRNVFNSWLKTCGSVYADLFIRVLIISLIDYIVVTLNFFTGKVVADVVLIFGLLLFLKEAPKFFCDMLGIKGTGALGNFTLNPFTKLKQVPVVGSAYNALEMGASTLISGDYGNIGKAMGQGWRKNGGLMSGGKEVPQGFMGRTMDMRTEYQKKEQEKNRQKARDDALYSIRDQLTGTEHSYVQRGETYTDNRGRTRTYRATDEGKVRYSATTNDTIYHNT